MSGGASQWIAGWLTGRATFVPNVLHVCVSALEGSAIDPKFSRSEPKTLPMALFKSQDIIYLTFCCLRIQDYVNSRPFFKTSLFYQQKLAHGTK
jgi:hypothetical protein